MSQDPNRTFLTSAQDLVDFLHYLGLLKHFRKLGNKMLAIEAFTEHGPPRPPFSGLAISNMFGPPAIGLKKRGKISGLEVAIS